jgi:hypothetical protein
MILPISAFWVARITGMSFHLVYLFIYVFLQYWGFTLSNSTSPIFVKGFLGQGLSELFAWAGFELRSS